MAAIAVVNASLMAWLWRFPMKDGVSTAPRAGVNTHRALGYVFVLTYAVLLVEMVPRMWEFRVVTSVSVVHGALGIFIGVVLAMKIAIIRRFQRFGHRLPWFGGTLAVTTLVVSALGIVPAWRVLQPLTPMPANVAQGREVVSRKCNQCHGASVIAGEREDARKWARITREMQRFSREIPGKEPITDEERELATAFLVHTRGEDEDDEDREENDDDRDRRGRGRGRGRD